MKRKILVVSTSFPGLTDNTKHLGGAAFLGREVNMLANQRMDIDVLMPAIKGAGALERSKNITLIRNSYPMMNFNPGFNLMPQHGRLSILAKISQVLMAIFMTLRVRRLAKKNNYDLIWSNWLQVGVICKIANLFLDTPHICTIRGSDVRESKPWAIRLMRSLVPNILNMYEDDPELRRWIEKYNFKEWKVPNVYDAKNLIHKPTYPQKIVVVGRLDGEKSSLRLKGLGDGLITTLQLVLEKAPDIEVVFIGDGKRKKTYQMQLANYGDRVKFLGWLTNFDEHLEAASLVIGAGGLNGVTMDCTPYSIPVIISKNLTGTLWQNDRTCYTYDPADNNDWYQVIIKAIRNPKKTKAMAITAATEIESFALQQEDAAPHWHSTLEDFIKNQ